jgi:ferric-dicitrate binding protein FerR (iron transport regulator)
MRVLHDQPKVTDTPPTEADVLIEEARRRQRRRWRIGTAFVVVALVGVLLAYVVGGFGGNGPRAASIGSPIRVVRA